MDRTINYQITEEADGLRIEQFLRHQGYSYQNITQLKKMPESILKNGVWEYMRSLLATGDILTVHIQENESSPNIPPVELPLSIIYEDEDILVVNKPAGMPIHPSLNNYENSLANGLMWYYTEQGKPFIFRCTNRLDRDTSGLTVIAKHLISSSILSSMGARHEIKRGERAVTHYKVVEEKNGHSLVSLILETGRTHQIRVHMQYLGFPLVGDYLYNPDMEYIHRQALHSWKLSFIHPITKEPMEFTAELPKDMKKILI